MIINTTTLCLATLAVGGLAFASQDPKPIHVDGKTPAAAHEHAVHIYRADKLKGLDIKGDADKDVGDIEAMIVDSDNGQIAYAIVSQGGVLGVGERKFLLPWRALKFSTKEDKDNDALDVHTTFTKEQIAAFPEFKKGEVISEGIELKAYESAKIRMDSTLGLKPARLVSSADIDGCKVRSKSNEDLGKVERLLVDPMEARIAYTVLDTGGLLGLGDKHIAMPWQITEVNFDKDQKAFLVTSLTKDSVEAAPMYTEKEWKRMTSPVWLRELAAHFKVDPYWSAKPRSSVERSDQMQK